MRGTMRQSVLRYLKNRRHVFLEDIKMLDSLIKELENHKTDPVKKRKINWEKEIIKAIDINGGEATESQVVNTLKLILRTDIQLIKKKVSAAFVLNPNKRFRKYKVRGKYKYSLAN